MGVIGWRLRSSPRARLRPETCPGWCGQCGWCGRHGTGSASVCVQDTLWCEAPWNLKPDPGQVLQGLWTNASRLHLWLEGWPPSLLAPEVSFSCWRDAAHSADWELTGTATSDHFSLWS